MFGLLPAGKPSPSAGVSSLRSWGLGAVTSSSPAAPGRAWSSDSDSSHREWNRPAHSPVSLPPRPRLAPTTVPDLHHPSRARLESGGRRHGPTPSAPGPVLLASSAVSMPLLSLILFCVAGGPACSGTADRYKRRSSASPRTRMRSSLSRPDNHCPRSVMAGFACHRSWVTPTPDHRCAHAYKEPANLAKRFCCDPVLVTWQVQRKSHRLSF